MSVVAIIPARGGSKGIPGKNIAEVAGRPLIAWSICHARRSTLVDSVIVTTDDTAIAEVAEQYGALYFNRSPETATDTASSESAIFEVIQWLEELPRLVVFLQATSPIRQRDDIDNAIRLIDKCGADSLFSSRRIEGYTWIDGKIPAPTYMDRKPRQKEHCKILEENGSIYVFKPWVLLETGRRLGGRICSYLMHPLDGYQVDEPADLELMETLIQIRCGSDCHAAA